MESISSNSYSEEIQVKFIYKKNGEDTCKVIKAKKDDYVKTLLRKFLAETKSIKVKFEELSPEKIYFQYAARLLNEEMYLNKKLYEIKIKNNHIIRVVDTANIIGGNIY